MLRITASEADGELQIKLEGKLAGAWVAELENCWRKAAATRGNGALSVDLTGVDSVDAAGKYLLALMHKGGARFITSGCLISELVKEIRGQWPVNLRVQRKRGCRL